jgi:hypothetical protein
MMLGNVPLNDVGCGREIKTMAGELLILEYYDVCSSVDGKLS